MARKSRGEAGAELAKSLLGEAPVVVPTATPPQHDAPVAPGVPEAFNLPGPDEVLGGSMGDVAVGFDVDLTSSYPDELQPPEDPGTRVPVPGFPGLEASPEVARAAEEIAARRSETDKAPPPLFVVPDGMGGVAPDIARITMSIYEIDAHRDYQDIERSLEIGDERTTYSTLMQHLDKGEVRARRAHALYLGAKLELAKFEIDSQKVVGAMRSKASEVLEDEKASGTRKKAITNADIEAQMADMFPDEWAAQELTRVRLKGGVEHLERLADLCKGRCHTLGTMLSNLRK